jgi:hypothetical protein
MLYQVWIYLFISSKIRIDPVIPCPFMTVGMILGTRGYDPLYIAFVGI